MKPYLTGGACTDAPPLAGATRTPSPSLLAAVADELARLQAERDVACTARDAAERARNAAEAARVLAERSSARAREENALLQERADFLAEMVLSGALYLEHATGADVVQSRAEHPALRRWAVGPAHAGADEVGGHTGRAPTARHGSLAIVAD